MQSARHDILRSHRQVLAAVLAIAMLVTACGCALMPASGPAHLDIRSGQRDPDSLPYALVKITPEVTRVLAAHIVKLTNAFPPEPKRPREPIRFGIGDSLSVSIFEAAAGGLFIPAEAGVRPGNFITLPNQRVDANGKISVPYTGGIVANGRTAEEIQRDIVNALKNRAIEPQAVVSLVEQLSSMITIQGDVNGPAVSAPLRFPASQAGERILDVIARAGGPTLPGHETWVSVQRAGRVAVVPWGALVYEPENNILVKAEDTIYLWRDPQTFTAFGATGTQGQFSFDNWRISLAEAVAKAGGLNDTLAEPASVFLYRGEPCNVAQELGIDCSSFDTPVIPVTYSVNFRDPAGYFLATRFQMRTKDVLYVSNADTVQASKAMQFFRLLVGTAGNPIVSATNALVLRNTIKTGIATTSPISGTGPAP
jgi:polysaccharide export outer membrane protein